MVLKRAEILVEFDLELELLLLLFPLGDGLLSFFDDRVGPVPSRFPTWHRTGRKKGIEMVDISDLFVGKGSRSGIGHGGSGLDGQSPRSGRRGKGKFGI